MKKLLCFILCIAMLVPVLSGCGSFFAEAEIKIKDIVPETLEDGRTQITIMYTDSRIPDEVFYIAPGAEGAEGKEGVGIADIDDKHVDPVKDENGEIIKHGYTEVTVIYTDEREPLIFEIPDGIYVVDADPNAIDEITGQNCVRFTYSDGTTYDLLIPKGDKGDKGDTGVGIDTETSGMLETDEDEDGVADTIKITLNFTNETTQEISFPKGVGIEDVKVELGASEEPAGLFSYYLVITYTNGEESRIEFPTPSQWYSGQYSPHAGIPGRDGDYYFAEKENKIWRMIDGQWTDVVTLGGGTNCTVKFDLNAYLEDGRTPDNKASMGNYPDTYTQFLKGESFASNSRERLAVPVPTREGYKFCGWYASPIIIDPIVAGMFTDLTPISSDITLYAKWEPIGE